MMVSETLQPVVDHFEKEGVAYTIEGEAVHTGFRCRNGLRKLRAVAFQGALIFQVPELLHAGADHKDKVLARVAHLNYELALVRVAVDARDGEVRADLVLPPAPGPFTEGQVQFAIGVLLTVADEHAPELELLNILGYDPRAEVPRETVPDGDDGDSLLARLGYGTETDEEPGAEPGDAADHPGTTP